MICIVKKHLGGHIAAVSAKYLFFTCEQDHKMRPTFSLAEAESVCSQNTLVKSTLTSWKSVDFLQMIVSGCFLLS